MAGHPETGYDAAPVAVPLKGMTNAAIGHQRLWRFVLAVMSAEKSVQKARGLCAKGLGIVIHDRVSAAVSI